MRVEETTHSKVNPQQLACERGGGEGKGRPGAGGRGHDGTGIYVLPIDNYVDIAKANASVATSKSGILLLGEGQDEEQHH